MYNQAFSSSLPCHYLAIPKVVNDGVSTIIDKEERVTTCSPGWIRVTFTQGEHYQNMVNKGASEGQKEGGNSS